MGIVRSFNQHLQTHATRDRSEQDKAHPQGGSEASDMTAYIELIEARMSTSFHTTTSQ